MNTDDNALAVLQNKNPQQDLRFFLGRVGAAKDGVAVWIATKLLNDHRVLVQKGDA